MKKQFTKIKIAAENLSRSNKPDRKDFELETIEKQVEKYRDVLDKMVRKLPTVPNSSSSGGSADLQERDKRIKKQTHYKIGQALEESSKELSKDMPLHHVLVNCGELEKSIAECIVDSELETECEVVRRLKLILDNEIQEISTLKRNVSRTLQEYASLKRNYEAAIRLDEPQAKINHIKDQQEQCEIKLEKERDSWAAQMFELIAKEDVIVQCIRDYVLNQRNYHERALQKVNSSLANIQDIIQSTVKSRFGTSLTDHLDSTNREISYIIELCVCCLVENGLSEEGLLRVGCASTKLRRMKHALEAQYVKTPLPLDYQDPHVIGSILKLYLRELPEPLLTFKCYKDFLKAVEKNSEEERKIEIKNTLAKLPTSNYLNLRYLTKFLWLVTQNVDCNKMSSHNLAIVMSPNMLWPRVDKNNPADYMGQVNSSSAVNIIVELLISQWDYFFEGEVDFFVTLQRGKLFVEDKSKSNSSNENLDRHDIDISDSPRYGTIRRQKPCAPSPPAKPQNIVVSSDPNGSTTNETIKNNGELQHNNHQRAKELFPSNNTTITQAVTNNNNNSSSAGGHIEKPEIPPLPKQLLLQQQQQQTNQNETNTTTTTNTTHPPISAKPVPMTRTQFFGLDNLPSPTADRKSNDSVSSLNFKPDLPQKPKIPKRPMVLGLSTTTAGGTGSGINSKSDEESTPTNNSQNTSDCCTATNGSLRGHKTAEQLVQEHCDNVTALQANIGSSNTSIPSAILKETNHNNHLNLQTTTTANHTTNNQGNLEVNANAMTAPPPVIPPPPAVTVAKVMTTNTNNTDKPLEIRLTTPTTPVSPNMIMTPKRPTVPAPPPPTSAKKLSE
ncbi:rho GTPase-activating protein 92B [Lucilia sericata]|uniref:rho GTPase-activating protein 92B n=1 Tax=Lucilia sericata TaxID=13632 RepID=UPI0018A7F46C|nr:rho GTPase-activating protein 92B [Lucilia sericata]XP_037807345.1 rho GTPase-activating protein 92B [Lucilia sericata]